MDNKAKYGIIIIIVVVVIAIICSTLYFSESLGLTKQEKTPFQLLGMEGETIEAKASSFGSMGINITNLTKAYPNYVVFEIVGGNDYVMMSRADASVLPKHGIDGALYGDNIEAHVIETDSLGAGWGSIIVVDNVTFVNSTEIN